MRNLILPLNQQKVHYNSQTNVKAAFRCNFYGSRSLIMSIQSQKWERMWDTKSKYHKPHSISSKISINFSILINSNHIYISLIFFINVYFPLIFFIYFLSGKAKYREFRYLMIQTKQQKG